MAETSSPAPSQNLLLEHPQQAAEIPVEQGAQEGVSADERLFMQHHDMVTKDLLGLDYEYAQQSGLLDIFAYDPKSGKDALLHILTGDVTTTQDGLSFMPGGYHHEPSSRDSSTHVRRDHIAGRNSNSARHYKEVPFNPYAAQTTIEGFVKTVRTVNGETGEQTVVPDKTGMFPKEYDALTVIHAIKQAADHRDVSKDAPSRINPDYILSEGTAVMLDGESRMRIRLCLDKNSGKIISAYPVVNASRPIPNDKAVVRQHLGLS